MITKAKELGTILGVWGHPDDEAYLSAGIMSAAVEAGQRVVCVTATRGELGFADDDARPLDERAALRESELDASFAILGVTEHVWLDYPDGGCRDVDLEEAVGKVVALIEEIRPDTLLTFGPDGGTYHDDHIAVSRWTTIAHRRTARPGTSLYYAARTPEWEADFAKVLDIQVVMMTEDRAVTTPADELAIDLEFDDALLERKVRALRAHASQIEPLIAASGVEPFERLMRAEFYRAATDDDFAGER